MLCLVYVQVSLLRAHSAEHLILGVARRSLPYNDIILLGKIYGFQLSLGCALIIVIKFKNIYPMLVMSTSYAAFPYVYIDKGSRLT